jgi:hypothetical protein
MAEDFITHDQYRADVADFRSDMARFREGVRADLGQIRGEVKDLRVELYKATWDQTKWLCGVVIVTAGVALAVAKLL